GDARTRQASLEPGEPVLLLRLRGRLAGLDPPDQSDERVTVGGTTRARRSHPDLDLVAERDPCGPPDRVLERDQVAPVLRPQRRAPPDLADLAVGRDHAPPVADDGALAAQHLAALRGHHQEVERRRAAPLDHLAAELDLGHRPSMAEPAVVVESAPSAP